MTSKTEPDAAEQLRRAKSLQSVLEPAVDALFRPWKRPANFYLALEEKLANSTVATGEGPYMNDKEEANTLKDLGPVLQEMCNDYIYLEASPLPDVRQYLVERVGKCARKDAEKYWKKYRGPELEPPLKSGAIALVDAHWLVSLAARGGKITYRQDAPPEAFISLDELKLQGKGHYGLRIIVISYPWLQPDHPDPLGRHLARVARVLKAFIDDLPGGRWAVLWDFLSLHQHPNFAAGKMRTDHENTLFKEALGSLGDFYAHQVTGRHCNCHHHSLHHHHCHLHLTSSTIPPTSSSRRSCSPSCPRATPKGTRCRRRRSCAWRRAARGRPSTSIAAGASPSRPSAR